jgi:nucleotide-binding universal stress UspA family protein
MPGLDIGTCLSLRSILFATDFSAHAERAFPFAFRFAQRYGAAIHVAHVIPPESPSDKTMEPAPAENNRELINARGSLAEFLACAPAGVQYSGVLEQGDFGETFAAMAKRQKSDLVVIATRGRQGLEKFLLGSVAQQVIGAAVCPVLVVGPRVRAREVAAEQVEQIIYATDFSMAAAHALTYATALSQDFDARLVLVNVVAHNEGVALHDAHAEAEHERVQESERALMKLRLNLETLPHEPEIVVIPGEAGEVIAEVGAHLSAGLIVVGARSRRLRALSARLPCGTTQQVVSRSECPVLIVPETST